MLNVTEKDAEAMIERCEPVAENLKNKRMGIDGFAALLREELAAKPLTAGQGQHDTVSLDEPLHHYFWSASHKSYLAGGQVQGLCTADAIVAALSAGARSIESKLL
jgi:hypothetical protein